MIAGTGRTEAIENRYADESPPWALATRTRRCCVLGTVTALILRSDPAAAPSAARSLVPQPVQSPLPAELPAVNAVERKPYIVQAESAAAARIAVQRSGGTVSSDLEVIRAVGAALNGRELSALRQQRSAHLQIYDDTAVSASSAGCSAGNLLSQ